MKRTITTLIALFIIAATFAQDKIYIHIADEENTMEHLTYIDHPDLNGNPDAGVLFCQSWSLPSGGPSFVYNNNPTGIWYSTWANQWVIFNENFEELPLGAVFHVYIADDSEVFTHVATEDNSLGGGTWIDHLGVSAATYLFHSNYFNPNAMYNPRPYGNFWDQTLAQRVIFSQFMGESPVSAGFKVMIGSPGSAVLTSHTSSASNINGNSTMIDHPALNNNPSARFIYAHYWGLGGAQYQVELPHYTGAWYNDFAGRWTIFNQDLEPMPENIVFDLIIPFEVVTSVVEEDEMEVSLFPNPTADFLQVSSQSILQQINVFDLTGRIVLERGLNGNAERIDLSGLPAGTYIVRVSANDGEHTSKVIKL